MQVVLSCALAVASAQVEPKLAKILKEQRFNAGDGRAGSAFQTEDGVIFKEETDIDGNRIGQYSYVGDDGNTYVVRYSAGKEGFRILDGDHVPSSGLGAAAFVEELDDQGLEVQPAAPQEALPPPPPRRQPVQQQQPRLRVVQEQAPQPQFQPQQQQFQPQQQQVRADPNFNPFINFVEE